MKKIHLSALSLAVVLGLVLTGCGEDKPAVGQKQVEQPALDLYAKTLAQPLRTIAWDIGDAEQVSVIPALALHESIDAAKPEGATTPEVQAALEKIDAACQEFDRLKIQLLTKLAASDTEEAKVDALRQEGVDLRAHADKIEKAVDQVVTELGLDKGSLKILMMGESPTIDRSIDLDRRTLEAHSYDVDELTDLPRTETLNFAIPAVNEKVAALDERLLAVRKEAATSQTLNRERVVVLHDELNKISEGYASLKTEAAIADRDAKEAARAAAEKVRADAEKVRADAEKVRSDAEAVRAKAEAEAAKAKPEEKKPEEKKEEAPKSEEAPKKAEEAPKKAEEAPKEAEEAKPATP